MSDMGGEPTSRTILSSKTQRIWRTPLTRARGDGWRGRSAQGFGEGDDFRRGGVQVREKADAGFLTLIMARRRWDAVGSGRLALAGPSIWPVRGNTAGLVRLRFIVVFTAEKSRRATVGHRSRSGC